MNSASLDMDSLKEQEKAAEVLNSFAAVLQVLLPSKISQKYDFGSVSEQFRVEIIFPTEDSLFQPIATRRDFALLLDGLNGDISHTKCDQGMRAVFNFKVSHGFLQQLTRNIECWALIHPILAFKANWRYANTIKVVPAITA